MGLKAKESCEEKARHRKGKTSERGASGRLLTTGAPRVETV